MKLHRGDVLGRSRWIVSRRMSQQDVQIRNKRKATRDQLAIVGSPGKSLLKPSLCVSVSNGQKLTKKLLTNSLINLF